MAASSSSSSSVQKSFKYDVFLSFRGTDTRKNFIDHLYQALKEKAIYTYKDDERIMKGKKISDDLLASIEDSQFYIVVFSKNYASSSWCLEELVKIMECHKTKNHTAYPVFLDVEPTEVRHQTGAVGEAFSTHEHNEAAGQWRKALKDAADLAGWELKNTANGSEASFIKKIIEDISLQLYTINCSFDKKLVGIETRVNDIVSCLEIGSDDVRMIGIKGMGGAKTTLARAVFDKISIQFEGKSFVENVREVTTTSLTGLKSMQQQILSDVLNEDVRVSGVRDGQNIMKRRMHGRKVLIALDDVNDIEQLEALAGEPDWFKSGSRIIITTRDEQVLLAHRVTLICDANLLSNKESLILFSRYAFGREGPIQGYEELSEQVLCYAVGLPLTIKVLGSLLFGKDKPEWEDALLRLKTIPLAKTLEILELSYTALEGDLKEIFLDVACMLKGWQKDKAIKVLESFGFRAKFGLRVLQQKSLLTVDHNECVGMHDHIEEMGRNIVCRSNPNMPHKHSRLWKNDEIEHIFANDLGTEETKCLLLDLSWGFNPYIIIKGLGKMKKLRFLSVTFSGGYDGTLDLNICSPCFPNDLGYLCSNYYPFRSLPKRSSPSLLDTLEYMHFRCYPFRTLPKTFQAKNLVSLEMPYSQVEQLWVMGEHKVLDKLRFIDLSGSNLRTLDLRLALNLETLNLRGCCYLVELPYGVWTLKHLRSLNLFGCKLLKKLHENLGRLECLEHLDLSGMEIKYLPDSICMLKHLKSLHLSRTKLLELPKDLGHIEGLECLDLSCTKIKHLPNSICKLKHLKRLHLYDCKLFEKLPEDLGHIECLEDLNLLYTEIKHLPDSICMLKHLKSLRLSGCELLEKLHEDLGHLECLENLDLSYTKIKYLPNSICMLKHLKCLHLYDCKLLEKLPEDLGHLECLEDLDLRHTKIKHLPNSICKLKHLKSLDLSGCKLLEKLHVDIGRLECLKDLSIQDTNISHIPQSILSLRGLRIFGSRGILQSVGCTSQIELCYFYDNEFALYRVEV